MLYIVHDSCRRSFCLHFKVFVIVHSSKDWLEQAIQFTMDKGGFDESLFCVGILGDLHIKTQKLEVYYRGQDHWIPIVEATKKAHGNAALVLLGDLGESKNYEHNLANDVTIGTED